MRNKNFYKGRRLTLEANVRWKIIITCIVLILGILALMPAVSGAGSGTKFTVRIQPLELDIVDVKFHPIEANDHYNYSVEAVNKFPTLFKLLRAKAFDGKYDDSFPSLNENLTAWMNDSTFKDFILELNGTRDALNLFSTERALYMGRVKFSDPDLKKDKECTATAATGTATHPKNRTFLHQNIDTALSTNPLFNLYAKHVFISKIEGENNYAFFQYPIFHEYFFVNEKGVGFGGNAVTLDTSFNINTSENDTAMPIYWLCRKTMMEADNVDDVEDLWHDTDRASGADGKWPQMFNNMNTMWCDSNDGILAIEQMNDYFVAKTENPIWQDQPDILWNTNHHRWNDSFGETGSKVWVEGDSSYDRNIRAYELLNDTYYGSLDYYAFIEIASDHGGGLYENLSDKNDICRHNIGGFSKTVFSWIIQPDPEIEMFNWIGGSPCRHKDNYNKINFTDLFSAEESGAISMSSYSNCPMGYQ